MASICKPLILLFLLSLLSNFSMIQARPIPSYLCDRFISLDYWTHIAQKSFCHMKYFENLIHEKTKSHGGSTISASPPSSQTPLNPPLTSTQPPKGTKPLSLPGYGSNNQEPTMEIFDVPMY
ncbi:hypothetical protein COCNU_scaffold007609G000010 [Cocos nucifera]|nr:hypothetical protein [Cocos nucifera]